LEQQLKAVENLNEDVVLSYVKVEKVNRKTFAFTMDGNTSEISL
jgi:hypothetical protein